MSAAEPRSLQRRLQQALGERAGPLREVVKEAERLGVQTYLVGGPVRDLLLGQTIGDLDVLVSDKLTALAKRASHRLGGRAIIHERFLTATVRTEELRIDLSRARCETYARPGVLPSVRPATPSDDLCRRDFSINAMAIPLGGGAGSQLVDPLGGLADLEQRQLRVLHARSFVDDPTRLFRATRYCARLGFHLSRATLRLMREAIAGDAIGSVSGDRTRRELERLLEEVDAASACRQTDRRGLFSAVAAGWRLSRDADQALRRFDVVKRSPPWSEVRPIEVQWACGLRLLLFGVPARVRMQGLGALGMRGHRASETASDLGKLVGLRRSLGRGLSPGKLDLRLSGLGEAALLALYCVGGGRVAADVKRFAQELRHLKNPLDGHAVRRLGLEGREIGRLVRVARERALDGQPVDDAWLRLWLARRRPMR
jgi:tRNA nucleotidyltransferase (CCA-adding enzyme)